MAWPRNPKIGEMHQLYMQGYSLAQVAEVYECSRQSVHEIFKNNGLATRGKKELPFVEFNGAKYTMRNTGYFAKTDGERTLLHRDMYEFHKGEIPDGFDMHHIDEDKLHNEMSNFECISKSDHTRLHSHGQNQHTKMKREKCGS